MGSLHGEGGYVAVGHLVGDIILANKSVIRENWGEEEEEDWAYIEYDDRSNKMNQLISEMTFTVDCVSRYVPRP